jgi:hypothetical protein
LSTPTTAPKNSTALTWKRALIGGVVLFLVGFGIGLSQSETIREVETFTETETDVRTPAACVTALDYASEGFGRMSRIVGVIGQVSVAELERLSLAFSDWAKQNQAELERAVSECRAASD